MGHSKGAKGDVTELARRLSMAAAHLLPVSGLSALLHAQMQETFTFTGDKSTFHIHIGTSPRHKDDEVMKTLDGILTSFSPSVLCVGAGRLGLGLVIPSLCRSKVPFAIVQRPSSSWNPILERPAGSAPDATLNLAVNDDVSTSPMLRNQPLALP